MSAEGRRHVKYRKGFMKGENVFLALDSSAVSSSEPASAVTKLCIRDRAGSPPQEFVRKDAPMT